MLASFVECRLATNMNCQEIFKSIFQKLRMLDIGNSSRHRKCSKLIEHCPLSYKRE